MKNMSSEKTYFYNDKLSDGRNIKMKYAIAMTAWCADFKYRIKLLKDPETEIPYVAFYMAELLLIDEKSITVDQLGLIALDDYLKLCELFNLQAEKLNILNK